MKYYSTNNRSHRATLKEAVLRGLAPDGGLYMPETIATLPPSFFQEIRQRSFRENAFTVAKTLLADDLPDDVLRRIIDHTVSFDAPLVSVDDNIFSLELFHGPTLAFKDFGARFLSGLLAHFGGEAEREIVILVATSGDTGSAVANGFLGVPGTRVVVLYPSGKVSDLQEKQFTTLGENVTAVEVEGTFDDCQRLVKQAFADEGLTRRYLLTSANSINIARLIPQTFYYFHAYAQLAPDDLPIAVAVPSGNFGNLTAGLIARRMGLPVEKFIVATNSNDVVPEFLATSVFKPRASRQTISNAMDVGNPSNFFRMLDLYHPDPAALKNELAAFALSDGETREVMRRVYARRGYTLDPHGAVAYGALERFLSQAGKPYRTVFLETAHPGKFREVVGETLDVEVHLPQRLAAFLSRRKITIPSGSDYAQFSKLLVELLDK